MSVFSVDPAPSPRRPIRSQGLRRVLAAGLALVCLSAAVAESAGASGKRAGSGAAAAGSASGPVAESFAALLAAFAEMPGFEARFVEEKTLSLLAFPLRSEGRIYFAPPSLLLRDVISPQPQKILVRANQIRLSGASGEDADQVIDLSARSEIRPLVESLIWIFNGDRAALERAFRIEFESDPAGTPGEGSGGWTLRLVPRDAPLSQLLARLVLRGRGLGAEQIEVEEVSGDRSLMTIFEADPARTFSPAEFERIFGISAEDVTATGSHE